MFQDFWQALCLNFWQFSTVVQPLVCFDNAAQLFNFNTGLCGLVDRLFNKFIFHIFRFSRFSAVLLLKLPSDIALVALLEELAGFREKNSGCLQNVV